MGSANHSGLLFPGSLKSASRAQVWKLQLLRFLSAGAWIVGKTFSYLTN